MTETRLQAADVKTAGCPFLRDKLGDACDGASALHRRFACARLSAVRGTKIDEWRNVEAFFAPSLFGVGKKRPPSLALGRILSFDRDLPSVPTYVIRADGGAAVKDDLFPGHRRLVLDGHARRPVAHPHEAAKSRFLANLQPFEGLSGVIAF